ncbi:MAG: NAD(P)H-hydrate dehydratase [Solirubrobacteraceae bacterium]
MTELPAWLEGLPDAQQQQELDSWAIEKRGISGEVLMEHAGTGLAHAVAELAPEGRVEVVCGRGNNGGDGLVAARVLTELGREVHVTRLPDDGPVNARQFAGAAVIIDAMLGTGFSGVPREPIAGAIAAINRASAGPRGPLVVACDVPSGVNGSNGVVGSEAVLANLTVTFNGAKPGLWISPGKRYAGAVRVIDIGIPTDGRPVTPAVGLIHPEVLREVPRRHAGSTKFTAGSVLVVGGSRGLTGAPVLAAMAAARAGAGYVTVAAPASVAPAISAKLLEVMTLEVPDDPETGPSRGGSRLVVERAQRVQAVVLGPGIGRLAAAAKFARDVATHLNRPLVLDADGLNAHAQRGAAQQLAERGATTVLTPHAGELANLLEITSAEVDAHRLAYASDAARRFQAIVVLKGDDTLVAEPDGRVAVSPGGAPALATAGTGDVLSGVIAAMLAKGVEPFTAVCAAVTLHLHAGIVAAEDVGAEGVLAGDVVAALPRAWTRLQAALADPVGVMTATRGGR